MSKKYIITIKSEYEDSFKGLMILGAKDSNLFVDTVDVANLEVLNSDYINEHFGDLQDDAYNKGYAQCQDDYGDALKHAKDTAYKKGLHDGESKCGYCNEYQRGLDDAWECGKKLAWTAKYGGYGERLNDVFGRDDTFDFYDYTPNEAIEKLKAYEEKQDDKPIIGEVVERYLNDKLDSTGIYLGEDGDYWNCLFWTGAIFGTFAYPSNQFKRTGNVCDIEKILEDMRND